VDVECVECFITLVRRSLDSPNCLSAASPYSNTRSYACNLTRIPKQQQQIVSIHRQYHTHTYEGCTGAEAENIRDIVKWKALAFLIR